MIQQIKTVKVKVKLPHVNKKLARKQIFVHNVLLKHRDQNHHFKNHKMV